MCDGVIITAKVLFKITSETGKVHINNGEQQP